MSAAAVWLLLACTHDPSCDVSPTSAPDPDDHRVTQQAALAELDAVLAAIDEPATRGTSPRTVRSVATVKGSDFGRAATRTGEGTAVEELVYIANFDDGRGYAILGADDRLPSVLAVTECGSLTAAEFAAVALGEYDDQEVPQPFVNVAKGVRMLSDGNLPFVPPVLPPYPVVTVRYTDWEFIEMTSPLAMVPIKWNQGDPYNYYCPDINKNGRVDRGYVGCVAVAIGQILTTNVWNGNCPPAEFFGGYEIDWPLILEVVQEAATTSLNRPKQFALSYGDRSPKALAVARMLRAIGIAVEMKYYDEDQGSAPDSFNTILPFFRLVDMNNPVLCSYNEEKVAAMLEKSCPVFVNAQNTHPGKAGHAYVIDGICKQRRYEERYRVDSGTLISRTEEYRTLFHCNFGYDGRCDGYYFSRVFDLEKGAEDHSLSGGDITPDKGTYKDRNYSKNIKIITYSIL